MHAMAKCIIHLPSNPIIILISSHFNPVADCGALNDPPNGIVAVNETTFGSVADYICNEGFTIVGNVINRTCQAEGRWTEAPICAGKHHLR